MEEPQLHLYVHRILKLLDTLLHSAEVGGEVALALFLHEGEGDGEEVEKVINSVQNGVQGVVGVSRQEELMLH